MRLDKAVLSKLAEINRSNAQKLIKAGLVKVNNRVIKLPGKKISDSDKVQIDKKHAQKDKPKLKIKVIYEDKNCIVLDKPEGVLTHSKGAELLEPTIASWLAEHLGMKQKTNRDFIVHRLDRGTSGVIICAKNQSSHKFLQKQFSARRVRKEYIALISGQPKQAEAFIEVPIERDPKNPKQFKASENGKYAKTYYKILSVDGTNNTSKVMLRPETGRTHQIRVHMNHIGHPIVGDKLYGGLSAERMYLHAHALQIKVPSSIVTKNFNSKLPKGFNKPKII